MSLIPENDTPSRNLTDDCALLTQLFYQHAGSYPQSIVSMGVNGGSRRRYYRLGDNSTSCIGTVGDQVSENRAFLYLTSHFLSYGLPVPEVYCQDADQRCYLQQDLGDVSLYNALIGTDAVDKEELLEQCLQRLVQFQTGTLRNLDFAKCNSGIPFDRTAARWDLDYMKYMFLRVLEVDVDELALEKAFDLLLDTLFEDGYATFMYRDFQSRNIMLQHEMPWFIDYQGGRLGPPAYDAASLLYQSRIELPRELKKRLTDHYASLLSEVIPISQESVAQQVQLFAVLRLLQTLGAYGFRGIIQRKQLFVHPIKPAIHNTIEVIQSGPLSDQLGVIVDALDEIGQRIAPVDTSSGPLKVSINSFSYMHGIPSDPSGHGGGFVFDCRALPNPHHQPEIRRFCGKDKVIADWLQEKEEVQLFLDNTEAMVTQTITTYLSRGFSRLQVSFGCTGGKHRSVYCAEQLARRLNKRFQDVVVDIRHIQLEQTQ